MNMLESLNKLIYQRISFDSLLPRWLVIDSLNNGSPKYIVEDSKYGSYYDLTTDTVQNFEISNEEAVVPLFEKEFELTVNVPELSLINDKYNFLARALSSKFCSFEKDLFCKLLLQTKDIVEYSMETVFSNTIMREIIQISNNYYLAISKKLNPQILSSFIFCNSAQLNEMLEKLSGTEHDYDYHKGMICYKGVHIIQDTNIPRDKIFIIPSAEHLGVKSIDKELEIVELSDNNIVATMTAGYAIMVSKHILCFNLQNSN